jgi:hypothetical protein
VNSNGGLLVALSPAVEIPGIALDAELVGHLSDGQPSPDKFGIGEHLTPSAHVPYRCFVHSLWFRPRF